MKLIDNPKNPITEKKVELGKNLYFDRDSPKVTSSHVTPCHNLATGGVDGVGAAIGHKWTANPHHLNSPTVYNAVFMSRQFWDDETQIWSTAQGPIKPHLKWQLVRRCS